MRALIIGALCLINLNPVAALAADSLTAPGGKLEIAAPVLVAATSVQEFGWAPDGRYAWALARQGTDNVLTLWSSVSSKSTEMWRGPDPLTQVTGLHGSPAMLAVIAGKQPGLVEVSGGNTLPYVFRGEAFNDIELFPSPAAALVAAKSTSKTGISVTLVGVPGATARIFTLPETVQSADVIWSRDGKSAYIRTNETPGDVYYALDATSGKSTRMTAKPDVWQRVPMQPLAIEIKASPFEIKEGQSSATRSALWLRVAGQENGPATLISSDCTSGQLSPVGNGVLYLSQDALFVRLFSTH